MHNESLKDQIVDSTAEETNLNGSKPSEGYTVQATLSKTALLYGIGGLVFGVVIGRKLSLSPLALKTARATHEVADKVEEAAA